MPGPTTGIGPALREARMSLGKSLEEASRDTKIKPDYLQALEKESFESLRGEVYVRGFLRSYSSYLGLDPDKVITAYRGNLWAPIGRRRDPRPEQAPPISTEPSKQLRTLHRRANWKLAFVIAGGLLAVFAGFGLLNRSGTLPVPDVAPSVLPSPTGLAAASGLVYVYLDSLRPTRVTVVADGRRVFHRVLQPGHPQQFTGATVVRVMMPRGGRVKAVVNGHDLGAPGVRKQPYEASFTPMDYREATSPSPS